jgi:hypothetical protein
VLRQRRASDEQGGLVVAFLGQRYEVRDVPRREEIKGGDVDLAMVSWFLSYWRRGHDAP